MQRGTTTEGTYFRNKCKRCRGANTTARIGCRNKCKRCRETTPQQAHVAETSTGDEKKLTSHQEHVAETRASDVGRQHYSKNRLQRQVQAIQEDHVTDRTFCRDKCRRCKKKKKKRKKKLTSKQEHVAETSASDAERQHHR